MEHFGLTIAVIGPGLILLNLIVTPMLLNIKFGTRFENLFVALTLALTLLALFIILESFPSFSSLILFLLLFALPQLFAYVSETPTKKAYILRLVSYLLIGFVAFIVLGALFSGGNVS